MRIEKNEEFTTKNSYKLESFKLSRVTNVSNFNNGDNIYAIKFEDSKKVIGSINEENFFKKEMILSKQTVEEICENPHDFQLIVKKDNTNIYFISKEFIPYFSNYGERFHLNEIYDIKNKEMEDFINSNCFNNPKDNTSEFIQLVNNKNHLKIWKTSDGELHTQPIMLDYIRAKLDNETYDLDLLVEHLMKRDDVAFLINKNTYGSSKNKTKILSCPLTGKENGVEEIINDIPYYNASESMTESISLIYKPKSKDIEKIMNWEMPINNETNMIWNLETYILNDLLNCITCSKVPTIIKESVCPKRKFKSS